ncbi:hypothetical protein BDZ89DRAFT_1049419 [Hymenopellis radicata]|nr:hypothetical protein BDZ89DRAFT_1049419 [Hymenopellis radicata]
MVQKEGLNTKVGGADPQQSNSNPRVAQSSDDMMLADPGSPHGDRVEAKDRTIDDIGDTQKKAAVIRHQFNQDRLRRLITTYHGRRQEVPSNRDNIFSHARDDGSENKYQPNIKSFSSDKQKERRRNIHIPTPLCDKQCRGHNLGVVDVEVHGDSGEDNKSQDDMMGRNEEKEHGEQVYILSANPPPFRVDVRRIKVVDTGATSHGEEFEAQTNWFQRCVTSTVIPTLSNGAAIPPERRYSSPVKSRRITAILKNSTPRKTIQIPFRSSPFHTIALGSSRNVVRRKTAFTGARTEESKLEIVHRKGNSFKRVHPVLTRRSLPGRQTRLSEALDEFRRHHHENCEDFDRVDALAGQAFGFWQKIEVDSGDGFAAISRRHPETLSRPCNTTFDLWEASAILAGSIRTKTRLGNEEAAAPPPATPPQF